MTKIQNKKFKKLEFRISNLFRISDFGFRISKNRNGQALFEVILAIAIFGFLAATLVSMVIGGFNGLEQGGEWIQANALAREGIEGVRSIRSRAWNENIYTASAVEVNAGEWIFSGEGTEETIGQFTRTISFADVCRDSFDEIAPCPSAYIDVHSKLATIDVTWTTAFGFANTAQRISYITNWGSRDWIEDTTAHFSDGSFTDTSVSSILGDGDGVVILTEQ